MQRSRPRMSSLLLCCSRMGIGSAALSSCALHHSSVSLPPTLKAAHHQAPAVQYSPTTPPGHQHHRPPLPHVVPRSRLELSHITHRHSRDHVATIGAAKTVRGGSVHFEQQRRVCSCACARVSPSLRWLPPLTPPSHHVPATASTPHEHAVRTSPRRLLPSSRAVPPAAVSSASPHARPSRPPRPRRPLPRPPPSARPSSRLSVPHSSRRARAELVGRRCGPCGRWRRQRRPRRRLPVPVVVQPQPQPQSGPSAGVASSDQPEAQGAAPHRVHQAHEELLEQAEGTHREYTAPHTPQLARISMPPLFLCRCPHPSQRH